MKKIIIFLITINLYGHNNHINTKEKNYLKENKVIKYCINNSFAPLEFIENSSPKGISIDILNLLENKLNISFKYIKVKNLNDALEKIQQKKCDLTSVYNYQKDSDKYLTTNDFLIFHQAIITKKENNLVSCISTISDKTVALKKGTSIIQNIKIKHPKKKIIEALSYEDSLNYILHNKAFYSVMPEPIFKYLNKDNKYSTLHIAGFTEIDFKINLLTKNDNEILISILNKSIEDLTTDIFQIKKLWKIKISKSAIIKPYINYILFFALFVLIILFYQYYSARKYNKKLKLEISKATNALKTKNNQLKHSLKSFQELLDIAMETIVVLDDNHNIIEVNNAALNMFGFTSKEEPIGLNAISFIPQYEINKFYKAIQEDISKPNEIDLYKKDKTVFPALVGGKYIIKNDKKLRITTIIDLTDLKRKDQQLRQQTKIASMGEMISMIAHQWRQPLNVLGALNMKVETKLEFENTINKEYYQEVSTQVNKQLQYMSKTIDDFRDFYKPNNSMQTISFENITEFALNMIRASIQNYNISLEVNLFCKDSFDAYQREVQQVLLNLLKNSLDVLIERDIKNPRIDITSYSTSKHCILTVKDNGQGIKKEFLEKIFEPYFTTKTKMNGTGLGLYMSKVIIEDHCQGKIEVNNDKEGAVFKIIFNKKGIHNENI